MVVNKKSLRKCVATGEMLPKINDSRRSFKEGEGQLILQVKNQGEAYVSKTEQAVEIARKKNLLDRQLDAKVPDEIYEELLTLIRRESIL